MYFKFPKQKYSLCNPPVLLYIIIIKHLDNILRLQLIKKEQTLTPLDTVG